MARQLKDEDRSVWRAAMRGVKPLRLTPKAPEEPPASRAVPSPVDFAWRRDDAKTGAAPGTIDRRTLTRIKRGELAIDARLDLHGLTQEAAHRALARFIATTAADGARLALVITGKGRGGEGILRAAVPRWLAEPALRTRILAVTPAAANHGGAGALYLLLRRPRS